PPSPYTTIFRSSGRRSPRRPSRRSWRAPPGDEVETGDEGAEPHAGRDRGEPREERPGFPGSPLGAAVPSIEVVVADPNGVEARILRRQRHGHVFGPANLAFHLGELNTEPGSSWHGGSLRDRRPATCGSSTTL